MSQRGPPGLSTSIIEKSTKAASITCSCLKVTYQRSHVCQDRVTACTGPQDFIEPSQQPPVIGVTVSLFQLTVFPLVYPEGSLSWELNAGELVLQAQAPTLALDNTSQLEFFHSQDGLSK